MHCRLAFTAEFWGDAAVLCRALEDRPGPIVDQQFGEFETWTQASAYAAKLNEGLELDPCEARQIVTSAALARDVLLNGSSSWNEGCTRSCCVVASREMQAKFLLAELDLALTFCRLVQENSAFRTERLIRNARNALFDGFHFISTHALFGAEFQELTAKLEVLELALVNLLRNEDHVSGEVLSTTASTEC